MNPNMPLLNWTEVQGHAMNRTSKLIYPLTIRAEWETKVTLAEETKLQKVESLPLTIFLATVVSSGIFTLIKLIKRKKKNMQCKRSFFFYVSKAKLTCLRDSRRENSDMPMSDTEIPNIWNERKESKIIFLGNNRHFANINTKKQKIIAFFDSKTKKGVLSAHGIATRKWFSFFTWNEKCYFYCKYQGKWNAIK